jgi:hypothetical protein
MPRTMPSVDLVTRTDSVAIAERQVLTPAHAFDALENWEEAELRRYHLLAASAQSAGLSRRSSSITPSFT